VLPHAGITIIAVRPGEEKNMLRRLLSERMRAGLHRLLQSFEFPDDPLYLPFQWRLTRIQGEEAWDLSRGEGALVAVLATGLASPRMLKRRVRRSAK